MSGEASSESSPDLRADDRQRTVDTGLQVTVPVIVLGSCFAAFVVLSLLGGVLRRIYLNWRKKDLDEPFWGPLYIWLLFLTRCPLMVLILGLGTSSFLSFLGAQASGYTVNVDMDIANYMQADSELMRNQVGLQNAVESQRDRRLSWARAQTAWYWTMDIYFESKEEGEEGNVFTPEALTEILDFERSVAAFPGYERFCLKRTDTGECYPPDSVTNIFFSHQNRTDDTHVLTRYDGSGSLQDIQDTLRELARNGVFWWTDKDFSAVTMRSRYSRARFRGGLPLEDGDWVPRFDQDSALSKDWLVQLYEELLQKVNEGQYQHITISWYERMVLYEHEVMQTLWHDCLWAIGAFIGVMVFLIIQIRSVILTLAAMLGVILSFTTAYYFYLSVAGYQEMNLINFLALFLVTGIAADDVLVMFSSYEMSSAVIALGENPKPVDRMLWAYYRAGSAMLVTTATTCGSFYSLCMSALFVVRRFGFFMGTVVALNYIHVMVIFPSVLLLNELHWLWLKRRCAACCGRRRKLREPDASEPDAAAEPVELPTDVVTPPDEIGTGRLVAGASSDKIPSLDTLRMSCISRCFNGPLFKAILRMRYLLIFVLLGTAIVGGWRAVVDVMPATGLPQVFLRSRNIGRLMELRTSTFSSYSPSDLQMAKTLFPTTADVVVQVCPQGTSTTGVCSDQGTCNSLKVCECDVGFFGSDCSSTTREATLRVVSSPVRISVIARSNAGYAGSILLREVMVINDGDTSTAWTLSAPQQPWLSVSPLSGYLGPRNILGVVAVPTLQIVELRLDLSGRMAGWTGVEVLELSSAGSDAAAALLEVRAAVNAGPELLQLLVLPGSASISVDTLSAATLTRSAVPLIPSFSPQRRSFSASLAHREAGARVGAAFAAPTEAISVDGVMANVTRGLGTQNGITVLGSLSELLGLQVGVAKQVIVDALAPSMGLATSYVLTLLRENARPPGPAVLQRVVANDGNITALFAPPLDDGGSDITGYQVIVSPGTSRRLQGTSASNGNTVPCMPAACWTHDAGVQLGEDCCEHTVSGLENDRLHTVTVRAVSGQGSGELSVPQLSEASWPWVPVAPRRVPLTPNISAAPQVKVYHGEVELELDRASVFTGGAVPLGSLTCAASPGDARGSSSTAGAVVVRGLDPGQNYTFACSLANARPSAGGQTSLSPLSPATVPVMPNISAPPAPQLVAVSLVMETLEVSLNVQDIYADQLICTATATGSGDSVGNVLPISVPGGGADFQLLLLGLEQGATHDLECQIRNTARGRTPLELLGPASPALQLAPAPRAPVLLGLPTAGSANRLTVALEGLPDSHGPLSNFSCTATSPGRLDRRATSDAPPVVIAGLANGASYSVACSAFREVVGLPGSFAESPPSTSSPSVLVGTPPPAPTILGVSGSGDAPVALVLVQRVKHLPPVTEYSCMSMEDPLRNVSLTVPSPSTDTRPTWTIPVPVPDPQPDVAYAFRCWATNGIGDSGLSRVMDGTLVTATSTTRTNTTTTTTTMTATTSGTTTTATAVRTATSTTATVSTTTTTSTTATTRSTTTATVKTRSTTTVTTTSGTATTATTKTISTTTATATTISTTTTTATTGTRIPTAGITSTTRAQDATTTSSATTTTSTTTTATTTIATTITSTTTTATTITATTTTATTTTSTDTTTTATTRTATTLTETTTTTAGGLVYGSMDLQTSDSSSLNTADGILALKEAISSVSGVPVGQIQVTLTVLGGGGRRLASGGSHRHAVVRLATWSGPTPWAAPAAGAPAAGRRLQESVRVDFVLTVSPGSESTIGAQIESAGATDMTTAINAALTSASIPITVDVLTTTTTTSTSTTTTTTTVTETTATSTTTTTTTATTTVTSTATSATTTTTTATTATATTTTATSTTTTTATVTAVVTTTATYTTTTTATVTAAVTTTATYTTTTTTTATMTTATTTTATATTATTTTATVTETTTFTVAPPTITPTTTTVSTASTVTQTSLATTTVTTTVSATSTTTTTSTVSATGTTTTTSTLTSSTRTSSRTTATTTTISTSTTTSSTTTTPLPPPDPPVIEAVEASGDGEITVQVSNDNRRPVLGASCRAVEDPQIAKTLASSTLVFSGLPPGADYTFECAAYSEAGMSEYGERFRSPVTVLTLPGAPRVLSVSVSGDRELTVQVSSTSDGGSPVLGTQCASVHGALAQNTSDSLEVVLGGLSGGVAYTFECTVENKVGRSSTSSVFEPAVTAVMPPPAPELGCLVPKNEEILVGVVESSITSADPRFAEVTTVVCSSPSLPGKEFEATKGIVDTANVQVAVRGLASGAGVRLACLARSAAGDSPRSEPSQAVAPGVAVVGTYRLERSTTAEEWQLRAWLAEELAVDLSSVVADVAREGESFDGCVSSSAGPGTARRLSGQGLSDFLFQVKVMVRDDADPEINDIVRGLNSITSPSSPFVTRTSATINVLQRPYVATPEFVDSTLRSLTVKDSRSGVALALVPPFDPRMDSYEVNVTNWTFTVEAVASSGAAFPVETTGGQVLPVTLAASALSPASTVATIRVTARDMTSTEYQIRAFMQPMSCSGPCNNGTCDGNTGTCQCNPEYFGDDCSVHCSGSPPCSGRGTCSSSTGGCSCEETYGGADCSARICPECNNGTCAPGQQELSSSWGCQCRPTHEGPRCRDMVCPNDCSGAGDCDSDTGLCTCYSSHEGADCSVAKETEVPIEFCVEVALVWGISGYDEIEMPIYDLDFNLEDAATQSWLLEVCRLARINPKVREVQCFMEAFNASVHSRGRRLPLNGHFLKAELARFLQNSDYIEDVGMANASSSQGRVQYVRQRLKINLHRSSGTSALEQEYNKWVIFVNNVNSRAGPGLQMMMVSESWTQMAVELSILNSTAAAFAMSVGICLVAVLIFTGNILISLYTVLTTVFIICALFGFVISVMRWEFGAVQAVAMTTFVGMSVDYTLHLSHAYYSSPAQTSRRKVHDALVHLGPAILGGATTTAGATVFLFPSWIYLFYQLGVMLFMNTVIALTFSFFFLAPTLMIAGPVGDCASIYSLLSGRALRRSYWCSPGPSRSELVAADDCCAEGGAPAARPRDPEAPMAEAEGNPLRHFKEDAAAPPGHPLQPLQPREEEDAAAPPGHPLQPLQPREEEEGPTTLPKAPQQLPGPEEGPAAPPGNPRPLPQPQASAWGARKEEGFEVAQEAPHQLLQRRSLEPSHFGPAGDEPVHPSGITHRGRRRGSAERTGGVDTGLFDEELDQISDIVV